MKQNWLTLKARYRAWPGVFLIAFLALGLTWWDWSALNDAGLRATGESVFQHHQYYRLWTSLFVHGDGAHIFSNFVFFIPLMALVSAYFGGFVWLVLAILSGGLINALVLKTMPSTTALVGISGVVNWLGAVWLTLFYLIDRRASARRRFAVVLFVTFVLFAPDTYKPEVSYLSHFVGYMLGFFTGVLYYLARKNKFAKHEVYEEIFEGVDEKTGAVTDQTALTGGAGITRPER